MPLRAARGRAGRAARGRRPPERGRPAGAPAASRAVIAEALFDPDVCRALLDAVRHRRRLRGSEGGSLAGRPSPALRDVSTARSPPSPRSSAPSSRTARSSSAIAHPQAVPSARAGRQPGPRVGRRLSERRLPAHAAGGRGARVPERPRRAGLAGILQSFVPNEGDAWQYTLDALGRFYERVTERIRRRRRAARPAVEARLLERAAGGDPGRGRRGRSAPTCSRPSCSGTRTAELHLALAGDGGDAAFAPEPLTALYQRSLYQSMRKQTGRTFQLLRRACRRSASASAPRPSESWSARRDRAALRRDPTGASTPPASGCTATTTSARCSSPAATS